MPWTMLVVESLPCRHKNARELYIPPHLEVQRTPMTTVSLPQRRSSRPLPIHRLSNNGDLESRLGRRQQAQ